jgi:subtilisin family serine protease
VYTSDQINLALRGKTMIASRDNVGHGTAVAGVACGNGRAAKAQSDAYRGVAPDASLIVVRAGDDEMTQLWAPFAKWAGSVATAHHMPVVVNISAGSQYTEHDGTQPEESELDELVKGEKKGFAVVVAAGNEGEDQIVATGRFNSRRSHLTSFEGKDFEVTSRPSEPDCIPPLVCYFKHQDDWGILVTANQAPFLDDAGNQITLEVTKSGERPMAAFKSKGEIDPKLKQKIVRSIELTQTDSGDDSLVLPLPTGTYTLTAFGSGPKVLDGRFMFSLPMGDSSFFSMGSSPHFTISSPGNATGVITVGSYNNRNSLQSKAGTYLLNNELGAIAEYSSRGYRRDGVIKPDLVGPGSLQVSSLAKGSTFEREAISNGSYEISPSGKHTIWQGTSAAAPYVSGVIALMMQKNPNLGTDEIRKILIKSARADNFTGAVPNPDWGFGKVDLERALAATPASRRRR